MGVMHCQQYCRWLAACSYVPVGEPRGCHLCCRLEDEAEALRYHQESHRVYPVDMEVISWLGAFHVKNEVRSHRHKGRAHAPAACLTPLQCWIGMAAHQDEIAA